MPNIKILKETLTKTRVFELFNTFTSSYFLVGQVADYVYLNLDPTFMCASVYPQKPHALSPCPGKHESPTQYRFSRFVVLKRTRSGEDLAYALLGIGP